MRIRLGYVAIALNLSPLTSSGTVTYANYARIISREERLNKLKKTTLSNLEALQRILQYNLENDIHFYRITSALVPLATHPQVDNWPYRRIFKKHFAEIGFLVRSHNLRVDTHPDQFNVINSTSPAVINNTINNLWFHVHLFEDMNYPPGKMVIHIGGSQGGKKSAMQRFIDNLADFPVEIRQRLALENDDRTFDARDVLSICHKTNNPMVLDVHHHFCNNHGQELSPLLKDIFATWQPTNLPPKVHFSSPRDDRRFRNHHDYIDGNAFMDFVEQCLPLQVDFDVMLEAKRKDQALFKLVQDVQVHRKNWRWIDGSTLEV